MLQRLKNLLESETCACTLRVNDREFCRNCIYSLYVGVQLRERAETAQLQSLGLPKKCSQVAEEAL